MSSSKGGESSIEKLRRAKPVENTNMTDYIYKLYKLYTSKDNFGVFIFI